MAVMVAAILCGLWVGNTSLFTAPPDGRPKLLAHRGVAQRFTHDNLKRDDCTARMMLPTPHTYIENTLPSMRAAFAAGAAMIELDVHPTTDGQFAVFHDWTLECRTDGHGVTREHSLAALKRLDVGYGYTADGGKTYPLRGRGVGLIPSLAEVLAAFPGRQILINVKSADPAEGEMLGNYLSTLPAARQADLQVVSVGREVVDALHRTAPRIRRMSREGGKKCFLEYELIGWSGYVPHSCRRGAFGVPLNLAPYVWGWPNRLQKRMEAAGSIVILGGPVTRTLYSSGIDDAAQLGQIPKTYKGYILTNEIEAIGGAVRRR